MGRKKGASKKDHVVFPTQAWEAMRVVSTQAANLCEAVEEVLALTPRERKQVGADQEKEFLLALSLKPDTRELAFALRHPRKFSKEKNLGNNRIAVPRVAFEAQTGAFWLSETIANLFNRKAQIRGLITTTGESLPGEEVYTYHGPHLGPYYGAFRQAITDVRLLTSQCEAEALMGRIMNKPLAPTALPMPNQARLGFKSKYRI